MFCPKCGNQLPDGAMFCGKCGHKLEVQSQPQIQSRPTYASSPSVRGGASVTSIGANNRLPLVRLILSIVAVATLLMPWGAAQVITQGSKTANVFDMAQLVTYNIVGENNIGPIVCIILLACLLVGMLTMLIGGIMGVVSKKHKAGWKASIVGAILVVIAAVIFIGFGNMNSEGSLLSYAFSLEVTMTPWVCLIAAAGVGVIDFMQN